MSNQITTAAVLDALPEASIVRFHIRISKGLRPFAAIKRDGRWYLTGWFTSDGMGYTARDLRGEAMDDPIVVYRPGAEEQFCAWCDSPAAGTAQSGDGNRYPSCGHGIAGTFIASQPTREADHG